MGVTRALAGGVRLVLLGLLLCPLTARAVDVVEPYRWGFDGKVILHRFNPLSVLVQNNSPEAFDGKVIARKFSAGPIGEALVEPVYLAPFTSRWVQLYPLVLEDGEGWRLTFEAEGHRRQFFEVAEPKAGTPATIFLSPSDRLGLSMPGLVRLEDNLFPPMVTATDGLQAVVLSHTPKWDEPRQQSFLDWLQRGGTLHLLHDARGQFPVFGGALQVLNNQDAVTGGRILRHAKTPQEVDKAYLTANILPPSQARPEPGYNNYTRWGSIDDGVIQHLKDMTKPDHNWAVIYFLSLLYLGVFPVVYILGRKRWHFGAVYGVLILAVTVFSLGFHQVGKRGYGESTTVHAMALARALEPGQYDVTQWSHVFVTDGGDYRVAHKGSGQLYSSGQSFEAVSGYAKNGPGAEFVADIPPFTGRGVIHRMKIGGPKIQATLLSDLPEVKPVAPGSPEAAARAQAQAQAAAQAQAVNAGQMPPQAIEAPLPLPAAPAQLLSELRVKLEGDVAAVQPPVYVMHGNWMYQLTRDPSASHEWRLSNPDGQFVSFFQASEFHNYSSNDFGWNYRQDKPVQELFQQACRPVMQKTLFVERNDNLPQTSLPDGRIRLFFVGDMPPGFFVDNPALGKQHGKVVYSFDLVRAPKAK